MRLRFPSNGGQREEALTKCGTRKAERGVGGQRRHPLARPALPSALRPSQSAFTLIEVVLALSIAIAILVAALAFHHQATTLRGALLTEAERLAAVRQIMDRLAADLRLAPVHDRVGFTGDSNSLRFVTTRLPLVVSGFDSDLRRVTYRALISGGATSFTISGLTRLDEPAVDLVPSPLVPAATPGAELQGDAAEAQAAGLTNASPSAVAAEPLTEAIRFLNFRFWDGTAWRESWRGVAPPPGVEVTLGFEPLPADPTVELYPGEIFRRVIFLPAGRPQPAETNLVLGVNSR